MAKFTAKEWTELNNIVANLTIKRIPDAIKIKHKKLSATRKIKTEKG